MFACFYPGEYVDSTYGIDFGALYAQGYRGIIFDIDNTLVPHGAPADARAKALFAKLKELGFSCCHFPDNFHQRLHFCLIQRRLFFKHREVFLHLPEIRHAGERYRHPRNGL